MKLAVPKRYVWWACAAWSLMAAHGAALAQSAPAPAPGASAPSAPSQALAVPMGTGAGEHGANSPFAPLQPRADVVPWSVLTDVKTKTVKNRILPVFGSAQQGLHQKTQRVQGFMMPLDPGEKQRHFLISSVPLTCAFCLPGGPESMVEVTTKIPVRYSMEPVVVEGKFAVLGDDPYGMYYRMTDAVAVK
jgi:hypothetical protein